MTNEERERLIDEAWPAETVADLRALMDAAAKAARLAQREEDVDLWQSVGEECDRQHLESFADALGVEATRECPSTMPHPLIMEDDCNYCHGVGRLTRTLAEIADAGLEQMRERILSAVSFYDGGITEETIRALPLREETSDAE